MNKNKDTSFKDIIDIEIHRVGYVANECIEYRITKGEGINITSVPISGINIEDLIFLLNEIKERVK